MFIPDPETKMHRTKTYRILNPENWCQVLGNMIEDVYFGSQIRVFSNPDPAVKKAPQAQSNGFERKSSTKISTSWDCHFQALLEHRLTGILVRIFKLAIANLYEVTTGPQASAFNRSSIIAREKTNLESRACSILRRAPSRVFPSKSWELNSHSPDWKLVLTM